MTDLAIFIHTWSEELRTWPPLFTTVIGGLILLMAAWWLRPIYRKSVLRAKEKGREIENLWEKASKGQGETRRLAQRKLLREVGRQSLWVICSVIIFLAMYLWASKISEDTFKQLRLAYQEYIDSIDEQKDILRWRTHKRALKTICEDGPIRDLYRSISEEICLLEAQGGASAYSVCMAKRGWLVNDCQENSDDCVGLQRANECCRHGGLETSAKNFSVRCLEMETEELAIARWELICELRAQIEGKHKARHEMDRILITSRSYQACMLEQGWYVTSCGVGEDQCNEIEYSESVCINQVRDLLEHGRDISKPLYCLGREYSPSLDPIREIPPMN